MLWLVLGNIPVLSLHRHIEIILVILLRIPLYQYCIINYIFDDLKVAMKS